MLPNPAAFIMGTWLFVDSVASLIWFRKQPFFMQAIRAARLIISIILMVWGLQ